MPAISVIVPVYKVEQYLHRCVDSILGQTFADFELILVDDGSPDNCGAICDKYARKDPRVIVIHQENGGLSAARNTGIDWAFANSDSQWLYFADSDDFIHPESLERLLAAALALNVDISIGGFAETSGESPKIKKEELSPKLWQSREFFVQKNVNAVVAWGKLYRKELFKEIRYPVGKLHEDEYTTYKLLFACENIAAISAPLYGYYVNQEGITKASWSPRRLDVLGAFEERIAFFRQRGDAQMVAHSVELLGRILVRHYGLAEAYPDCQQLLRKRLRRILLRYRRQFPMKEYYLYYSLAFPKSVPCLRRVVVGLKRITKR